MSAMMEKLRELEAIEARNAILVGRRRVIERVARRNSPMVTGQARRLITDAVLAMLAASQAIDRSSLRSEVQRRAGKRDRFAVELCLDWLGDPTVPAVGDTTITPSTPCRQLREART